MNILLNAKQAMEKGGYITITTSADSAEGHLTIAIADTGEGFTPEKRDRIFDPFYTTRKAGQGTGLGLSISYGIIKEHGGNIDVDSTPDEGSCFRLILPLEGRQES